MAAAAFSGCAGDSLPLWRHAGCATWLVLASLCRRAALLFGAAQLRRSRPPADGNLAPAPGPARILWRSRLGQWLHATFLARGGRLLLARYRLALRGRSADRGFHRLSCLRAQLLRDRRPAASAERCGSRVGPRSRRGTAI